MREIAVRPYICLQCGNVSDVTSPVGISNKIVRKMVQEGGCRWCSSGWLQQKDETETVVESELEAVRI